MPGGQPEHGIRGMFAVLGHPHPDGGIYKHWKGEWPPGTPGYTPPPDLEEDYDPIPDEFDLPPGVEPPSVELPPGLEPIPTNPRSKPIPGMPEPGLFRRDRGQNPGVPVEEDSDFLREYKLQKARERTIRFSPAVPSPEDYRPGLQGLLG